VDDLKTKLWLLAASLGGGFTGQLLADEPLSRNQRAGFIIAGCCTAIFLIPWILNYYGVTAQEAGTGAAFLAGAFWKRIIVKASDLIDLIRIPFVGAKKDD
jgi:hypothetical protein